nr:MAG TPA: hypothetical protein [Caudoviricetes sp.]
MEKTRAVIDKTRCQFITSPPTELAQGARQMRH